MSDLQITAEQCREALVRAALREWESVVECRAQADRIAQYFRDCGWQWHLDDHAGGTYDEDVRRRTPHLEYCGIFVGWCGIYAGTYGWPGVCAPVGLRHAIAEYVLPSTYRASNRAKWVQARTLPPEPVPPEQVQRGDIVTVETSRGLYYGDHYAIVVSREGDVLETVEANASGTLGDGSHGRGVVRRTREIADVRRVYRLEARHFHNAMSGAPLGEVGNA